MPFVPTVPEHIANREEFQAKLIERARAGRVWLGDPDTIAMHVAVTKYLGAPLRDMIENGAPSHYPRTETPIFHEVLDLFRSRQRKAITAGPTPRDMPNKPKSRKKDA